MKIRPVFAFISLCIAFGPFAGTVATSHAQQGGGSEAPAPSPESTLAARVKEIAATPGLSRKEKSRRIAAAVREAVIDATKNLTNPDEVLSVATDLATAAAQAVPNFAGAIRDAVVNIPAIANINGAVAKLQTAITTAAAAATADNRTGGTSNGQKPGQNSEFGGNSGDVVVSPSR
jgi:hypothetical protein